MNPNAYLERLENILYLRRDIETEELRIQYHYQSADGRLLFRYDNSPHYPHLSTFPSHKHVGNEIIAAEPPEFADVLREIDTIIYPQTDKLS